MAASPAARRPGGRIDGFDESRPMWRLFLVFLAPLMLSNVLQSISQTLNSIYLGRMIGVLALAAVSAIFPIVFLLISFLIGIASGSTVLIGQAFGAGDEHGVKKVAGTTLGATVALSILIGVAGYAFSPDLLGLLGTPANILHDSDLYARIVFVTAPVLFPYLVYTTFLRGTGDSQTPLYFLLLSTAIGLVATPAFIAGWFGLPHLGVASAAVASFVAQLAAFAALLGYLHRTRHPLRFDLEMLRDMRIDWKIFSTVVRIGIPAGVQMITVSLAEIAVLSFVNRFGSSATAAYGAVNQVASYVQFPALSIGITASIFGAQCIGARREDRLGSVVRAGVGMNYLAGVVIIGLCYTFAWSLLGWFITDAHTLEIAHRLLMITLWGYVVFGNTSVLSGIMRSSGTVFWPTAIGIFTIWGVEVPVAYFFMRRIGLDGVWMGYPISFCIGLLLQYIYYRFVWKHKTHERLI
ncbi:MAG: MATE family efflux transporter [Vulcanimicrobiaceae bacterium]